MPIPPEPGPTPPTPTPTPPNVPEGVRRRPPDVPSTGVATPRGMMLGMLLSALPSQRLWIALANIDDDGELDVVWQTLDGARRWGVILSGAR